MPLETVWNMLKLLQYPNKKSLTIIAPCILTKSHLPPRNSSPENPPGAGICAPQNQTPAQIGCSSDRYFFAMSYSHSYCCVLSMSSVSCICCTTGAGTRVRPGHRDRDDDWDGRRPRHSQKCDECAKIFKHLFALWVISHPIILIFFVLLRLPCASRAR